MSRFSIFVVAALVFLPPQHARAAEAVITNQLGDSVSILNTATMTVAAEIKIGGKPAGVALSYDKSHAYVTAPDSGELAEVDLKQNVVARRIKLGSGPLGVAAHPTKPEVYVADWYVHKIIVIDTVALKPVAEVSVGQSPSGLAVTPDGKLLLSADRDSNAVSIIDIETRTVTATVPVGERPFGLTVDRTGHRAYTANVGSNDVTVVDIASRAVVGTATVGRRPYAVALAQGRAFVTDQNAGTISVFDTASFKLTDTIEACDHPEGIQANAYESALFIACWGDDVVLRLDAATLEITARANVGGGPRAFGRFLR
ncbi:MAG: hypothetical protein CTY31_08555 [Hyphomicrobium sp.]|nr:MAG: hypothetical protein CTY39_10320 [Hyphomicrobium sp.]PPC99927.1 MAG: hypothetical protein CTY31_08555 [Hyphomicrobium sp.]